MANWNIATGEDQPLNRVAADNVQFEADQGQLVGIDYSGTEPQVVPADAAAATAIHAVGAFFHEGVVDTSGWDASPLAELEKQLADENLKQLGDRVTFVRYGIEMTNDDDDTTFDPGEPVYLAAGGGYTQTAPAGTGDVVQVVGFALTPDDEGRDRIYLDVNADYTTA